MSPTKTTTKTKATKEVKLPPNPFIHEILELASKQRSAAKKAEILQEYRNDALTAILIWNFDDSIISVLPPGEVPYKENEVPVGTDHTSLRREWKHLYNFVKGGNDSLNGLRRETMFIQMLEGLHPEEAKILCLTKDKQLQTKYKITQANVAQAFPDIRWGDRS
jgi:hypothetical protein|tara:strand:- start:846 stop:1337 length:492 start_codon:yes stop_codon:yes gene_type:complete